MLKDMEKDLRKFCACLRNYKQKSKDDTVEFIRLYYQVVKLEDSDFEPSKMSESDWIGKEIWNVIDERDKRMLLEVTYCALRKILFQNKIEFRHWDFGYYDAMIRRFDILASWIYA